MAELLPRADPFDGASAPIQKINFGSPGSQDVSTDWMLGGGKETFEGWQATQTYDPENEQSGHATFRIRCI